MLRQSERPPFAGTAFGAFRAGGPSQKGDYDDRTTS